MHQIKIKYWIYLIALFFSFIPLLVISYISYRTTASEIVAAAYNTNMTYAELKIENMNQYFEELEGNANVIARSESISQNILIMNDSTRYESIRNEAETKLTRFLDSVKSEFQCEDVFITDENGIVIYGDSNILDEDLGDKGYIEAALNGKQYWSELFESEYYDTNVIVLSTPVYVYEDSITPIATVNIVISQEILNDKVHEGIDNIGDTGNAYLVDENGLLWTDTLYGSYQSDSALNDYIETDIISELSESLQLGKTDYEDSDLYEGYDGKMVLGVAGVVEIGETDLGIIIEINSSEALEEINQFRIISLVFFFTIVILTLIVIKILTNGIRKPLVIIDEYADRIVSNHLDKEMPYHLLARKDEFGNIAKSIKIIVEHLVSREKELEVHNKVLNENVKKLVENSNEIQRLNVELEYQAEHDFLTQLPNRRLFIKCLETELLLNNSGAILLLDLDNFKEINDTMGHIYGDQVLAAFSQRLIEISKEQENIIVARYGGDEFLILLKEYDSEDFLNEQISKIDESLSKIYDFNHEAIKINYSVGISLYPEDANNTYELITYADIAMYKAKQSVYEKMSFYNNEMYCQLRDKLNIKKVLEDALVNDGFELFYQPQLNVKTGMINSFEALIRIKNSTLNPEQFISVAEESQQIVAIGRWITETAIKQILEWQNKGYKNTMIAINFSLKQLDDKTYVDFLDSLIKKYNIDSSLLSIEITESIFMEYSSNPIEFLKKINDIGISLELDDFGSGYSSLKYLTYFELKRVKLDKEFNDYFLENDRVTTMQNVIDLFHSLKLLIVAEGLEGRDDCLTYREMGCDYIQSYYVSKPVPKYEAEKWINKKFDI